MNNRLEMLNWKGNSIRCRGLRSSRAGKVSSGEMFSAAQKDALRIVDIVIRKSVGPVGVPEWSGQLRKKSIVSVQTPTGGGGMIAQTVPRDWSVVDMTFSPKGSFGRGQKSEVRGQNRI